MTTLVPIQSHEVAENWHFAERWVRESLRDAAMLETVESYKARCIDGSAQLWLIKDGSCIGAVLTEVYDTPKGKTCGVPVAGCTDLERCFEVAVRTIRAWAASFGCVRMESVATRLGWSRALKAAGWRPIAVIIERDI